MNVFATIALLVSVGACQVTEVRTRGKVVPVAVCPMAPVEREELAGDPRPRAKNLVQ